MAIRTHLREDAESYKYAFLAATVASILGRPSEVAIEPEDVRRLKDARTFLEKLIAGTEVVTGQKTHVFATHESLKALSIILNPVHSIRAIIHDQPGCQGEEAQELLTALRRISNYLEQVAAAGKIIRHSDQPLSEHFFTWLADSLLQNVSKYPLDRDLPRSQKSHFALWGLAI